MSKVYRLLKQMIHHLHCLVLERVKAISNFPTGGKLNLNIFTNLAIFDNLASSPATLWVT